ncbi:hypothetical protein MC885_013014, partial [Smutsia gigantea]
LLESTHDRERTSELPRWDPEVNAQEPRLAGVPGPRRPPPSVQNQQANGDTWTEDQLILEQKTLDAWLGAVYTVGVQWMAEE